MIDFAAAQRPTSYVANSQYTQQKIKTYYQKESVVIYPPIDTQFYSPGPTRKSYFLCVGRLTREKKFDHAITVAEKLGLKLIIAGTGSDRAQLERLAGKHTTFAGSVSREQLRELYRGARALIQPGIEDFGMTAAEALACGTPVIAYGTGGAREIVRSGVHGILYQEQLPETLAEAIRNFLRIERAFDPGNLQKQGMKFATNRFRQDITRQVEYLLKLRNT